VWPVVAVSGLFLLSFSTWAFATPIMGVPDEPAHAIKAASVWQGSLRGQVDAIDSGNPTVAIPIPVDRVRVPASYAELTGIPSCFAFNNFVPASCAPPAGGERQLVEASTAAGPYSPLFYAVVGWPTGFLGADSGVLLMRLTAAVCSALFAGLAFAALRRLVRADLALIAVALAATPMVHFLAGSVNPNGLESVAAIALWCTSLCATAAIVAGDRPERGVVVGLLVSGATFALLRPLSPLFAVMIVAVAVFIHGPAGIRSLVRRRDAWLLGGALAVPLVLAIGWSLGPGRVAAFAGTALPPDRSIGTVLFGLVDDYFEQAVAVFGWKDTGPVLLAIGPWMIVVVALVAVAVLFGRAWGAWTVLAVAAGSLLLPVVLQWPSARTQGLAWQGRYQLPLLVGVPVVAAFVAAGWARSDVGPTTRLVRGGSVAVGAVLVVSHLTVMQRNVVGVEGPANYLLATDGWLTPWQRWMLLLASFVAAAGFPLLVWLLPSAGGAGGRYGVVGSARDPDIPSGGSDAHSGDRLEGPVGNRGRDTASDPG
jgi:hypothetical protein